MTDNLWQKALGGNFVAAQTAEELCISFMAYFQWCDNNRMEVPEIIRNGKDAGTTKFVKVPQPYSINGICLFCGITPSYLKYIATSVDEEYRTLAQRVLMIIQEQNVNWAMVGVFNQMMVSKLHDVGNKSLMDDEDNTVNINVLAADSPRLLENENEIDF